MKSDLVEQKNEDKDALKNVIWNELGWAALYLHYMYPEPLIYTTENLIITRNKVQELVKEWETLNTTPNDQLELVTLELFYGKIMDITEQMV